MSGILALLAAIFVFCSFLLVDRFLADKKRKESLRARLAPDGSSYEDHYEDNATHLSGDPSPLANTFLTILRGLGVNVDESVRKLSRRFAQAGSNSPDGPAFYLFFQRIGSLAMLALALLLGSDEEEIEYDDHQAHHQEGLNHLGFGVGLRCSLGQQQCCAY